MLRQSDILQPSAHVAYREIGGQVVVLQTLKDIILTLNETGSAIWSMLDGRTVAEIAKVLSDRFQVSEEDALKDTRGFLSEMASRELVCPSNEKKAR